MQASKVLSGFAAGVQNQILPLVMRARIAIKTGAADPASKTTAGEPPASLFLPAVMAMTVLALALFASQVPQPVPLMVLSALAALGLFFLLALACGRVNIAGRAAVPHDESIADAWPDAVLITTRLGAAVYSNPAFASLLPRVGGTDLGALESWFSSEPRASEALFRLSRAAERGETLAEEVVIATDAGRGGSRRAVRITVSPLDLGSISLGTLVLWRLADVTRDRETVALATGAVAGRLATFERAPLGLIGVRADGSVAHMNAMLAEWLGYTGHVSGDEPATLDAVFSRAGAELLQRALERMPGEGGACALDLLTRHGRRLPVRVIAEATPDGARGLAGERMLVVLRAAHVEPEIMAGDPADPGFARQFQSAPFGIATINSRGLIVRANPAFAQMALDATGGLDAPAIDVLCRDTAPAEREAVAACLAETLAGQSSPIAVDFAAGPKAEHGRRIYTTPLPSSQSSREAAILYVVDTTEQKALEAKFAQSQKMEAVGKLAGGIAHDFNNVLTAIIGSADLMLQTHRASDAAHKDIQNIKQSANRAAGLVAKLMAFSRQQTLQLEVLQLNDIVTDLRSMLKTSVGEKIELRIGTDRDLWYVKADRTQIDQVLVNLAVNAQHAMPNGGMFAVRTRNVSEREAQKSGYPSLPVAEYVLMEVEDSGTGMPPEVMAKIFEPFFTTKEVGKGTGLGLATVYGIIKQLSGFIYPESTPGKGAMFRIYLPRAHVENEGELTALKASRKDVKPADLTGTATVLIVEDEEMVRSVAVRSLTRLGYTVLEAGNGFEALDVVAANPGAVDIVISDVVMPEMDGPAFLKEVRKTNPHLKIIFVSGHTNEAFKASLDENETFAFVAKPFSLPQLAAKVKEELAR
jgi:two-component system, cell cycle sensor histidine kinase and response regulator CckA